ncbi:MAG: hypothetical protein HA494_04555 [Thaumarchaeota archaeon]|nr:hypothetical protein [Nitrososphaerota archaeon]
MRRRRGVVVKEGRRLSAAKEASHTRSRLKRRVDHTHTSTTDTTVERSIGRV